MSPSAISSAANPCVQAQVQRVTEVSHRSDANRLYIPRVKYLYRLRKSVSTFSVLYHISCVNFSLISFMLIWINAFISVSFELKITCGSFRIPCDPVAGELIRASKVGSFYVFILLLYFRYWFIVFIVFKFASQMSSASDWSRSMDLRHYASWFTLYSYIMIQGTQGMASKNFKWSQLERRKEDNHKNN